MPIDNHRHTIASLYVVREIALTAELSQMSYVENDSRPKQGMKCSQAFVENVLLFDGLTVAGELTVYIDYIYIL